MKSPPWGIDSIFHDALVPPSLADGLMLGAWSAAESDPAWAGLVVKGEKGKFPWGAAAGGRGRSCGGVGA